MANDKVTWSSCGPQLQAVALTARLWSSWGLAAAACSQRSVPTVVRWGVLGPGRIMCCWLVGITFGWFVGTDSTDDSRLAAGKQGQRRHAAPA